MPVLLFPHPVGTRFIIPISKNSHYGEIFTFLGPHFFNLAQSPDEINYGLKDFDDDNKQTVGYQIIAPFKKI